MIERLEFLKDRQYLRSMIIEALSTRKTMKIKNMISYISRKNDLYFDESDKESLAMRLYFILRDLEYEGIVENSDGRYHLKEYEKIQKI